MIAPIGAYEELFSSKVEKSEEIAKWNHTGWA
jgi:hypothetical protein